MRYQLVPRVSAVFSPFVHSTWRNHHHIPSLCASIQSPSFCTTYALADALRLFPLRSLMIASILPSSFAVYVDAHTLVPFRFRWLMVIPSSTLRFRLVPQSRHTVYISYSFRKRLRRPSTILLLLPVSRPIISFLRGFIRYVRPSGCFCCFLFPSSPLSSFFILSSKFSHGNLMYSILHSTSLLVCSVFSVPSPLSFRPPCH